MTKVLVCICAVLAVYSSLVGAQELSNDQVPKASKTIDKPVNLADTASKRKFTDWVLNCSKGNCIIHQYILDDKKRVVSSVSLHRKNGKVLVTYTVPLMTSLRAGIEVNVLRYDEKEIFKKKYQYSFCSRIGCMITYQEDPTLIAAMRKGRTFNLAFNSLEGRTVRSVHSLFGFGDAYQAFLDKTKGQ